MLSDKPDVTLSNSLESAWNQRRERAQVHGLTPADTGATPQKQLGSSYLRIVLCILSLLRKSVNNAAVPANDGPMFKPATTMPSLQMSNPYPTRVWVAHLVLNPYPAGWSPTHTLQDGNL